MPEAQLDRFLLRVRLGYPNQADEIEILDRQQIRHPIETLESVIAVEELQSVMEEIKTVYVSKPVKRYLVDLVNRTRQSSDVYLGASPRGSLALFKAAQALAAVRGRDHVIPDDIKYLLPVTITHRLIVTSEAELRGHAARGGPQAGIH